MNSLLGLMDQLVDNITVGMKIIIMDMKIIIMDMKKFITTYNLNKDQSRLRFQRRLKKL